MLLRCSCCALSNHKFLWYYLVLLKDSVLKSLERIWVISVVCSLRVFAASWTQLVYIILLLFDIVEVWLQVLIRPSLGRFQRQIDIHEPSYVIDLVITTSIDIIEDVPTWKLCPNCFVLAIHKLCQILSCIILTWFGVKVIRAAASLANWWHKFEHVKVSRRSQLCVAARVHILWVSSEPLVTKRDVISLVQHLCYTLVWRKGLLAPGPEECKLVVLCSWFLLCLP